MKKYKSVACALAFSICGWLIGGEEEYQSELNKDIGAQGISFKGLMVTKDGDTTLVPTRCWRSAKQKQVLARERTFYKLGPAHTLQGVEEGRLRKLTKTKETYAKFIDTNGRELFSAYAPLKIETGKVCPEDLTVVKIPWRINKYRVEYSKEKANEYERDVVIRSNMPLIEKKGFRKRMEGDSYWQEIVKKLNGRVPDIVDSNEGKVSKIKTPKAVTLEWIVGNIETARDVRIQQRVEKPNFMVKGEDGQLKQVVCDISSDIMRVAVDKIEPYSERELYGKLQNKINSTMNVGTTYPGKEYVWHAITKYKIGEIEEWKIEKVKQGGFEPLHQNEQ